MLMLALISSTVVGAAPAQQPRHVLFVVVDDLGFDDVGFRSHQIRTPHIDSLAAQGLVLDQYYVQDVCSPSRSTFMTGRYAMHHGIVDWIPPASAYGLPLNETTLAQLFKRKGFATHASGKWHLGFYKWAMTPTFRGFDSFVGFYSGGEDYFKHTSGAAYDFRRDMSPNCGANCSQIAWQDQGSYSTTVFAEEAVRVVKAHDPATQPLFLYLAFQGVHSPAQVPQHYADAYSDTIADSKRRTFAGMLSAVDEGIGNVTAALRAKRMLDDTLIIFTSDNGGPTTTGDGVGARNWPNRGGKHSVWDGGVRATSVISGAGIAPPTAADNINLGGRQSSMRQYPHLMHGADWLPTLAAAVGLDTTGTLPLDGVSQWAAMQAIAAGAADEQQHLLAAPRTDVTLGNSTNECSWPKGDPRRVRYEEGGLLEDLGNAHLGCGFAIRADNTASQPGRRWKLIRGYGGGPDTWCNTSAKGNVCDNHLVPSTAAAAPVGPVSSCPAGGCLYDLGSDPHERSEISALHADVVAEMNSRMDAVLASYSEYALDPACGKAIFANDSHVGKAWQPWC